MINLEPWEGNRLERFIWASWVWKSNWCYGSRREQQCLRNGWLFRDINICRYSKRQWGAPGGVKLGSIGKCQKCGWDGGSECCLILKLHLGYQEEHEWGKWEQYQGKSTQLYSASMSALPWVAQPGISSDLACGAGGDQCRNLNMCYFSLKHHYKLMLTFLSSMRSQIAYERQEHQGLRSVVIISGSWPKWLAQIPHAPKDIFICCLLFC